jgi:hypothetical protein
MERRRGDAAPDRRLVLIEEMEEAARTCPRDGARTLPEEEEGGRAAAPPSGPRVDELSGRDVLAPREGRPRGRGRAGAIIDADRPLRAFMPSVTTCRAFVSRTSGDGMEGRGGRVPRRVVVEMRRVRSSGDSGVPGGVSSDSARRTQEVGERTPTSPEALSSRSRSRSRVMGVIVAVEAVRIEAGWNARERDAARARIVDADRTDAEEKDPGAAAGAGAGRRAKPTGPFLTILPSLSSVVLMRACRSCRSLNPLVFVACADGGRPPAVDVEAPAPAARTRRLAVDTASGVWYAAMLRFAVERDNDGMPDMDGDDGIVDDEARFPLGDVMPVGVRPVGVDVLRATRPATRNPRGVTVDRSVPACE